MVSWPLSYAISHRMASAVVGFMNPLQIDEPAGCHAGIGYPGVHIT